MDIITVLTQGSQKAAAIHLNNAKFAALNSRADKFDMVCTALKIVLNAELPDFVDNELKSAAESMLGNPWLKEMINVQCNKWALDALNQAQAQL
jgi:hypothetical protein